MKEQPIIVPTPWFLAPLYSRGKFSPRPLAAWVLLWATVALEAGGGILNRWPPGELIWANTVFCAALFGLGTLQKIQLDAPAMPPANQPSEGAPTE